MARTRKGQIITLKQAIMHELFKTCAVGGDWVVLTGGKVTIAAPLSKDDSEPTNINALRLEEREIGQHFDLTDRKGKVPTGYLVTYNLSYQWNDAIRSLTP